MIETDENQYELGAMLLLEQYITGDALKDEIRK